MSALVKVDYHKIVTSLLTTFSEHLLPLSPYNKSLDGDLYGVPTFLSYWLDCLSYYHDRNDSHSDNF